MEQALRSAIDLAKARWELRAFEERHEKFKQDYQDSIESLCNVNNVAILKDRLWKETKTRLTAARAELTSLPRELS